MHIMKRLPDGWRESPYKKIQNWLMKYHQNGMLLGYEGMETSREILASAYKISSKATSECVSTEMVVPANERELYTGGDMST